MDKVIKNKTSHSLPYETSSEKLVCSLYTIWPSLIMFDKAVFEFFQNYISKIHDIINDSMSIFYPSESGKCGEEGKKIKIWISWEQKEIFRWKETFS